MFERDATRLFAEYYNMNRRFKVSSADSIENCIPFLATYFDFPRRSVARPKDARRYP